MPSKTVCFFNSNRAWGGGEKWHLGTAMEFQRRGYETLIVANNHSQLKQKALQERMRFYTFHISNLSFLNPIKVLTLVAFFKTHRVEAIVLNLPADLKLAGIAAKLAGIKTIIYRRGMPHPLRNTFLNRFLFQRVLTHVVVNSEEIGRNLREGNEEWFPREKLVLVYNGVNTHHNLDRSRKLFPKYGEEIMIGNAGRLTEQKGQKYLLEMAQKLKNQNLKFRLLIAGEGELKAGLQAKIQEMELENEVQLLGHVDDMAGFMNSLDVFVFSSLFEGSANTLIETLQMGVPCVAFDVSSNPEIIEHGVNGYLAKPFDVDEFTSYVQKLIQTPSEAREMVQAGERILMEKFDSSKNLNRLQQIIEEKAFP